MASTFTANAALEKIADGEQENIWGATQRTTQDEIDTLICGVIDVNVAGGVDVTLTRAQYLNPFITLSGAITANINLIMPAIEKPWFIDNNTSGAFTVTAKTAAGTGVTVDQGDGKAVQADGTNVVARVPGISGGGTGAITQAGARTNLGLGDMATQAASAVAITGGTITGITDLAVADGGSGASTAAGARTNFGLVIGTDVQADLDVPSQAEAEAGIASDERVWTAQRVSQAIAALGGFAAATQAEQETGTAIDKAVTPGRQHFHNSAAKAWVDFNAAGTVDGSYNVSSVTDNGTGDWTVNFSGTFSGTGYAAVGSCRGTGDVDSLSEMVGPGVKAVGTCKIHVKNPSNTLVDSNDINAVFYGDFS